MYDVPCLKCGERGSVYVDVAKAGDFHCTECDEYYTVAATVVAIAQWRMVLDWIQAHPDWNSLDKPDKKGKPDAAG